MAGGEGEGINGSIGVENQLISSMSQDDLQNHFTDVAERYYFVIIQSSTSLGLGEYYRHVWISFLRLSCVVTRPASISFSLSKIALT